MIRVHSKRRFQWAVSAFTALVLAAATVSAAPKKEAKKQIHGEGCVTVGVQPHCLMVRDLKSGRVYDLLFKGAPAPAGIGIEFTGVPHHGPTACMQGIPVDVTVWAHKKSLKCTPGQAGKS